MVHTDGRPTIANGAELDESRRGFTDYDFELQDEGTLVVLHPKNDAARSWIEEHLYSDCGTIAPTWWGGGVVIDHRLADDVIAGVLLDELTIH